LDLLHGAGTDAVRVPENSTGGLFGLFSPETAFSPPQNGILAVELDTFSNEWDPPFPHVGIDVNSLMSVNITSWPIHDTALGSVWNVRISYESKTKTLSVSMGYPGANPPTLVSLSRVIELRMFCRNTLELGFSAATGALIETHNLFAWSFRSFLAEESSP
ncbi:mannose/glucose-specific lectin-like, partial [Neltuma alba]|uniref:mannose/glucose-specific lectin-like n=1 Tax=Neltuma alba TaxID=207710 RepID=UPI0010A52B4B